MEQDELTQTIIGCAYKVSNILGSGFVEKYMRMHLLLKFRKLV